MRNNHTTETAPEPLSSVPAEPPCGHPYRRPPFPLEELHKNIEVKE